MNASKKSYPDGQVPCSCCGCPVGTSSVGYRFNRSCYVCGKPGHDGDHCAVNRPATIAHFTSLMLGMGNDA